MLLVQRFPEPIRLDDFERIDFTLDYQVVLLRQLSDWPARGSSVAGPDMNLQLYFLLREIEHPERAMWVGILLFASEPKHYVRHTALGPMGHRVLPGAHHDIEDYTAATRRLPCATRTDIPPARRH